MVNDGDEMKMTGPTDKVKLGRSGANVKILGEKIIIIKLPFTEPLKSHTYLDTLLPNHWI
jgi:hypothetical protein